MRESASVILFRIDFRDLSRADRGETAERISADKLARDNVAGRSENVKSPVLSGGSFRAS